ncbi:hypothetical protein [Alloalcanivorax gelatiniphagus]|uniref:Alginate export domain-containing protein n=1 Tax=Alloalcanivorax gelatiniphagus TaxID=1194167 RepID=A0ABY2XNW6_9GAMM|nr:hypothetical protein [Alloalcanivorax gelatiniphagus]TMW13496.1 hypothetical protein FGS76_06755 [Alloalcanivorax gelatiniphagus]
MKRTLLVGLLLCSGLARAAPDECFWQGADTLVDRTHGWLSRSLCWPSRWVDGFFQDPLRENNEPASSLVRVTGEKLWREDGDGANDVDVDARVWLPSAERRLSLLFRSRDEDRDEQPVARNLPGTKDDGGFRGALRWVVDRTDAMDLDVDVGARSNLTTFVRARYRRLYPLANQSAWLRYTQRIYWEDPDGWGSRSLVELDRPLSPDTILRFSTEVRYTEEFNQAGTGLGLFQGVNLFKQLGNQSALNLGVGAGGRSKPGVVDNYRLYARYRRNVWRPWLFVEVEPFMLWPREQDYRGISGVVLRLETLFGKVDV